MSLIVFHKLLAVFFTVALGWVVGRTRWLGQPVGGADPARTLGNAALYLFVPALLFRTTARLDTRELPWATLAAFFVPLVGVTLLVYAARRWGWPPSPPAPAQGEPAADQVAEQVAAMPATTAVTAVFGNSVQVGIPMAAAVFGEAGLGIHIAVVSLHAMVVLSVLTVLAELDIARARAARDASRSVWRTLRSTVQRTLIHPVVLPVVAGMLWQRTGWALPGPVDETLQLLGTAVAPLCLVLIGTTLAYSSVRGAVRQAVLLSALKLLVLPAVVAVVARWGFGLQGLALQVVILMAALPTGSNALIFAQRYRVQEAEATTAIVLSTGAYMLTAPLWLVVAAWLSAR